MSALGILEGLIEMISLGFLALGAFIGGIVGLFLLNADKESWKNPATGLTAMLGAVISGTPIALAQYVVGETTLASAFATYPIGLILGLMTPYLKYAAENYLATDKTTKRLGTAHFIAYGLIVVFGLLVFLMPGFAIPHLGNVDTYFVQIMRDLGPPG
ncbi:hypothetical protein [uncultured Roseobacter sp.]|uniref:hypothetical protein n=1 Tax=uncultured Roseobacter sp. TaxID=114847 RepID=UPI00262A1CF7|nr:hypothetical protein [uncultured Roseobacter sp.]